MPQVRSQRRSASGGWCSTRKSCSFTRFWVESGPMLRIVCDPAKGSNSGTRSSYTAGSLGVGEPYTSMVGSLHCLSAGQDAGVAASRADGSPMGCRDKLPTSSCRVGSFSLPPSLTGSRRLTLPSCARNAVEIDAATFAQMSRSLVRTDHRDIESDRDQGETRWDLWDL